MATPKKKFAIMPLEDRVVVKTEVRAREKKLASGILIPPTAAERPISGIVMAVGPGKYQDGILVPMQLKKGDEVLFAKYGHDEVKVEGEDYFILRESTILAVIE